jgi:hypothetical protein
MEEIKPHVHDRGPYCYLGGHICVQTENTKTVYINPINQMIKYETYESENIQSKIKYPK